MRTNYSAGEMTKLAEIIELAMGMWKYTPERDVRGRADQSADSREQVSGLFAEGRNGHKDGRHPQRFLR